MRSRVVRWFVSPLVWSILVLVSSAPAAHAAAEEMAHDPSAVTLKLYGAFTPAVTSSNGAAGSWWGYGGALQWATTDRWRFALDASHFVVDGRSIDPLVAGVSYSPSRSSGLRPWVELGGGYYRLSGPNPGGIVYPLGLGSSGNPRDQFARPSPSSVTSEAGGAFFGAGLDCALSSRLGLDIGARAHNWVELGSHNWDGMLSLRSGLSYRF